MRRLACVTGGFAASVFAFVYLCTVRAGLVASAVCAAVCAAAWLSHRRWSKRAALLLAGAAVGFGWCAAYWQLVLAPLSQLDGSTQTVTVTATDYSRQTDYGRSAPTEFDFGGRSHDALLYYDTDVALTPGDTVTIRAAIGLTGSSPAEDDAYLGSKGKSLVFSARGEPEVTRAEKRSPRFWPASFARQLRQSIQNMMSADTAPFVSALVTGDRTGFSFSMKNQLSVAGLYHAVAISGMHISILLGILLALLGSGKRRTALIALPVIWFYALAVGAGPPVIRAAVMQSLVLLAPLLGRESDAPTSLLAALALILLPNPRAAGDVSLQLSFASITGILLFSGPCFRFFWEGKRLKPFRKRHRRLAAALKVVLATLAASLAVIPTTLPLGAIYFGVFSLIAPLSSVLVLPVISLCFSWGLLAGLAGMLWPAFGTILAVPLNWLVRYCTGAASLLAKIPFAAVYTQTAYMVVFLGFFYALTLLLALGKRRPNPLAAGCCAAGMLCLCLLLGSLELDGAALAVTMLDVGQGQSVYLESGGVGALYDCGGSGEQTGEIVARYLQSLGRGRLDYLIVSHYDRDHTEGVAYLLSRLPVGVLLLPDTQAESETRKMLVQAAQDRQVQVQFVGQTTTLPFGRGSMGLYPQPGGPSDNDSSMAALCSVGDFDVLLTGDLSTTGEQMLLRENRLPDIEVLAAGHHGAGSSTSAALLRLLRPETALISVGEGNSYGHPASETLARLQRAGVHVYRTDQCGNITIRR